MSRHIKQQKLVLPLLNFQGTAFIAYIDHFKCLMNSVIHLDLLEFPIGEARLNLNCFLRSTSLAKMIQKGSLEQEDGQTEGRKLQPGKEKAIIFRVQEARLGGLRRWFCLWKVDSRLVGFLAYGSICGSAVLESHHVVRNKFLKC